MRVFIDSVQDLEMVERLGVVKSLTRMAIVAFEFGDVRPLDFSALETAMTVVPATFTTLTALDDPVYANARYAKFKALILVERNPKLIDGDPNRVAVHLKYEHMLDGPNQLLRGPNNEAPRSGMIFGSGRCSIVEKSTNFFYPRINEQGYVLNPDDRIPITVAHTFSEKDTGIMGQTLDPDLPFTIVQSGEVNMPFPQGNFRIFGVFCTGNPWTLAKAFIAKVNKETWLEMPPRTWICSEVKWDLLDPSENPNSSYQYSFEFQHNIDTWDQTVVFIDQRTGRPPSDVEQADEADSNGVVRLFTNRISGNQQPGGYWRVPLLQGVNFDDAFLVFQIK